MHSYRSTKIVVGPSPSTSYLDLKNELGKPKETTKNLEVFWGPIVDVLFFCCFFSIVFFFFFFFFFCCDAGKHIINNIYYVSPILKLFWIGFCLLDQLKVMCYSICPFTIQVLSSFVHFKRFF